MAWLRDGGDIDVLVVCTGNLCRSPIMQTVLAAAAPALTVRSAGTHATRGVGWHPLAVQALAEVGLPASGTSRRLRPSDVRSASLILTAEAMHRAVAIRMDASAGERTFPLLEAERLLARSPAPAGSPAALAAHLRMLLAEDPRESGADDLPDPLLGTLDDFRRCRDTVQRATAGLVTALSTSAA